MQWMKALPLALAVVSFGQTQQATAPVPDIQAPESAEHKYARQQFEPVTKLLDAVMDQLRAQGAKRDHDCSYQHEPNHGRPVFSEHEKTSDKKAALADYEARK